MRARVSPSLQDKLEKSRPEPAEGVTERDAIQPQGAHMAHGTVKWFNTKRGFGFISRAGFVSRDAGGADVFVHHSQVTDPFGGFVPGDLVKFTIESRTDGLRALDVHAA